jgi:phenylacetate-CoA ligase
VIVSYTSIPAGQPLAELAMRALEVSSKYLFYPIWDYYENSAKLKAMRALEKTDWLSLKDKTTQQWSDLKQMTLYAAQYCPFYQGKGYDAIGSLADFARLPLLTKHDIRKRQDELISVQFRKEDLIRAKTGGSTGTSLEVYFDKTCQQLRNAAALRCDKWSGWDLGKEQGCLWGNPVEPKTFKQRIRNRLLDRLIYLDTARLCESSLREFCGQLQRRRIAHLFGHAHSLYLLARYAEKNRVQGLRIRGIISTSMMLIPKEREIIEKTFRCKVTDRYGCEEVGLIACECQQHKGMHLNMDHVYTELVRNDGGPAQAGEEASIVVTDLINHGMPLIRYVVGDVAVPSDRVCSCGRASPLLERVVGRTADFLVGEGGRMVAGVSLVERTLTAIPGLEQLQIIQDSLSELQLNVVPDDNYGPETERRLVGEMKRALGAVVRCTIAPLPAIKQEKNGKYRFCICRVTSEYQERGI